MKFYELALITGQNPAIIENEWDAESVNMCLAVYRAQQEAKMVIAAKHKTEPHNIPLPTSIEIREKQ